MKNKGLIIGGVAIVALGAFWWMRKKNQMAEETSTEGKSDTSTSGGATTTEGGATSKGGALNQTSVDKGTKGTKGDVTKTQSTSGIQAKVINSASDLEATPLGLEISISLLPFPIREKIKRAIRNMTQGERQILNIVAVVDSTTRNSQAFKDSLSAKFGASAPSVADSVYNKIISASSPTSSSSATSAPSSRRDCRREALDSGIKRWQFRQLTDYVNACVREGGYDSGFDGAYFSQPMGEHAYSKQGFEIDKEDYEFNGDNIL